MDFKIPWPWDNLDYSPQMQGGLYSYTIKESMIERIKFQNMTVSKYFFTNLGNGSILTWVLLAFERSLRLPPIFMPS